MAIINRFLLFLNIKRVKIKYTGIISVFEVIKMPKLTSVFVFKLILLTILYFIAGKIGLSLAYLHPSASAVWPPTGIAIACVLIFGKKIWPAIYVGAFLVNVTTTGDVPSSLFIALGNTLEAIIAGYLVKRFASGIHVFNKPETILRFAALASGIATMASATIGVASLLLFHFVLPSDAITVWITWWLGDAGGALVITPVVILWYLNHTVSLKLHYLSQLFLLFISPILMAILVFSGIFPFPYLTMPIILWAAIGFGPRETATSILLVTVIATYFTSREQGPFVLENTTLNQSLILLQIFIGVVVVTKLVIAAVVEEKKRAQKALGNSEKRFRVLTEKSADATALLDEQGTIQYTSPSAQHIIGYTPEELDTTSVFALVHPQDLVTAKKTLVDVLQNPNTSRILEVRLKRKDNTYVWVEMNGTNLLNDPAVGAIVVNYRDISERKQLDEAKNEFLRIAAHQLRTPLSTMRWNMELLQKPKTRLSPDVQKKLSTVYSKVKYMVDLVNELLDVTSIIEGDTKDKPQKVVVATTIEKIVAEFAEEIKKKSLSVTIRQIGNQIPEIWIDQKRFYIVIQNIISNAIKYNSAGGTVEIVIQKKGTYVIIQVTDSGIGIPKADTQKIFTKFFRAANARTSNVDGTGLGLFVVKSYIEKWGGSLGFTSPAPNKKVGTQFVLSLPYEKSTPY